MPVPTDPLLAQQWHLDNPDPDRLDLNVLGVWAPGRGGQSYTGAGVRTVIIDDGFDYTHSDFSNYDQFLDFDFEFNTSDPFGSSSASHGTAVSGIIGAAANGTGAVGVAFGTSMVGYRTAGLISDAWLQDIRDAIYSAAVDAQGDVVNISQGIANDSFSEFGAGYNASRFDEIEASINTAVDLGRGGLGTTIVKAAGNSRAANYDVNADDWTNDTRQVVVAAVDQNGFVSSYSSYGAAILVSAFGTPGEVVTTDRVGSAGATPTDFRSNFNGTSSAAPMVAGVVALMYDANADLGWRDVQSILAASARHVGSDVGSGPSGSERSSWEWNDATNWNGGGMHFSNDYGYGLVDALAAVRLAETWLLGGQVAQVSDNEFLNTIDALNTLTIIPDNNSIGRTFTANSTFDDVVERVTVQMTFSTTFTGDMEVYLISPDGTVSTLIARAGDVNDFNGTWTFETQAFRGEGAAGTWSVRVVDGGRGDVLTVSDVVITTYGVSSNKDRYVFTNEYSDYAGRNGHRNTITDENGGTDTVNAAAVTLASVIRLDGLSGSIDGVAVKFTNIENAIGGDGNDRIYGNSGKNSLYGMRGNDAFDGQGGNDTMVGYVGDDTYTTDGGDTIIENASQGVDTVRSSVSYTLGANLENLQLIGSAAINGTGNAGANRLNGNSGNNGLNGGGGADIMAGGAGNDTYVTNGSDTITENAGQGVDTVRSSVDFVLGSNLEKLTLTGTANIDATGNTLANTIVGNSGANFLSGRLGNDTLTGGGGSDSFVFNTALGSGNVDRISDFDVLADTIRLENAVFTGLAGGTLDASAFARNLSGNAADASDRIIYETDTGYLYFDPDGNGSAARIHFATLGSGLSVTNADFFVF